MSCATRHPHLPPVPLSRSACLHCTLHTLQNRRALPTLRRAAAAALTVLPSLSSSDLTEATMMLVLNTLTDTLFKTPLLHSELLPLCASLASSWDFPTHGARAVLISSCIDVICRNEPPQPAIPLLSSLLPPSNPASAQTLPHVPISSADALCSAVLRHSSHDYRAASHVIHHLLSHVSPKVLQSIPSLLEAMHPPRPCDEYRQLFLQTAIHLFSSGVAFDTQQQRILNEILCASFMSSEPLVREHAAKLLQMCYKKSSLSNTFEYLIEGLREAHLPPLRTKRNALIKPNLAALSLLASSVEPIHWCYAFRSVLCISEYADGAIHHLCQVIKSAATSAPTSVFGAAIIPELVAFVMRLISDENLPHAVECLQILLNRYKTNLKQLEIILGVLECIVEKNILIALPIVRAVVPHFQRLADRKIPHDELQPLGRRLVIIIFDRCATQLEDFQCSELDIDDVIMMFSSGLHETFVHTGACSEEDRLGIQRWCWRFFPPRRVMNAISDSLPLYLWRICAGTTQSIETEDLASLCSEERFLEEICCAQTKSFSSPVFTLLDKAIQLHCVDDICLPEAILEALLKCLHILECGHEKPVTDGLRIIRLISLICFQNGLCFPAEDIKEQTIQNVLRSQEFSLHVHADVLLLRAIIAHSKQGPLDTSAWESITSKNKDDVLDDIITTAVLDEGGSGSILYALSRSTTPEVIVEGVLDVFERTKGYDALFKALTEFGALSSVSSVLRALPHQGMISSSETSSGDDIGCRRSKSFILLVSSVGSIPDSAESWDLLRVVCDTFTRESMSQLSSKSKIDLLAHLVRCIIALLKGLQDSGKIAFIRHSGVEAQGIKLLTSVSTSTRASGLLISSIACLLNLFMHKTDLAVYVMPELPINIEFLAEPKTWEKLLTPGLGLADVDETHRMANCWHLLNSLLLGGKGNIAKFQSIITPNIIILLHIAATSWSRLLSEAARITFRTILQHKYHEQSVLRYMGVFQEFCSLIDSNFCLSMAGQLSSSEILLLSELVRNSFINQHIPKLLQHVSEWCHSHEDTGQDLSQRTMFHEMHVLYRAIRERLQLSPEGKKGTWGTSISKLHEDVDKMFSGKSAPNPKYFPDVLLGRYTMIWRATDIDGSMMNPRSPTLEGSNAPS
ncbi:hypothetical protein FGB62_25g145 [Gracilaria domingensis]|nr:hypothetical protein FGB62_25g145 [Gracilaria domingensis]